MAAFEKKSQKISRLIEGLKDDAIDDLCRSLQVYWPCWRDEGSHASPDIWLSVYSGDLDDAHRELLPRQTLKDVIFAQLKDQPEYAQNALAALRSIAQAVESAANDWRVCDISFAVVAGSREEAEQWISERQQKHPELVVKWLYVDSPADLRRYLSVPIGWRPRIIKCGTWRAREDAVDLLRLANDVTSGHFVTE